jgi:hypothetical protein
MAMTRSERIALAQFLVGGLAIVFAACVLINHAQAQFVNSPPPPPPPVFNPSSPNTVPQPKYTPSRRQHQASFRDIGLRPLWMGTSREQSLVLTEGHPS